MLIAFYSNIRGNTGTTSNLCCLATYLAVRRKQRIVLWENHTNWNMIGNNITPRTRLSLLSQSIDTYHLNGSRELFCRLQQKQKLDLTCQVAELAKELYLDTLYYLPNAQMESLLFEKDMAQILPRWIQLCKESEDLVFMDLQDITKESTRYILEKADLVIFNLMQHVNTFDRKVFHDLSISNVRYLIGNYHPNSKYNIKNICRRYKIPNKDITLIPYNGLCREAMSEGKLIDFMAANVECSEEDLNYIFIHAVGQAATMIQEAVKEVKSVKEEQTKETIKTEEDLSIPSISKGRCEDCYI